MLDVDVLLQELSNTGKDFLPFPGKISAVLFLLNTPSYYGKYKVHIVRNASRGEVLKFKLL